MRRVLLILNLVALAAVLAAWPVSYWRGASIVQSGRGGMAIDTGALFFAGADVVATTGGWEFEFYHPEFPLESMEVIVASCTPCEASVTVSLSGHRVAATRRRRSASASSETLT
jgi:hypothetical protein